MNTLDSLFVVLEEVKKSGTCPDIIHMHTESYIKIGMALGHTRKYMEELVANLPEDGATKADGG